MTELTDEQKGIIKKCNEQVLENSKLMAEWKLKYPETCLVSDGIMDYYKYAYQKNKILFILKEYNNTYEQVQNASFELGTEPNLKHLLFSEKGNFENKTYSPIAKWTDIILNKKDDGFYNNAECRYELLRNVAIMNLSKIPGGASTSDTNNKYREIAEREIELLKKQYLNINPNIVIVCSNIEDDRRIINKFTDYEKIEMDEKSSLKLEGKNNYFIVRRNSNKTFIFTHHPSVPNSNLNKYFEKKLFEFVTSLEK